MSQSYGKGANPQAGAGEPNYTSSTDSVCPRHPDRPSLIRCQRCDRPACVECQRRAAVGVQCVDCVSEAEHSQRQSAPRTVVGAEPVRTLPVVTYTIMGLCAVIFALQFIGLDRTLSQWFMFAPFRSLAMPWTFLTSGFLHGGIAHVGLNLYALWAVGQFLERALGHWRYLAVFLVSVFGGHTAVLLLSSIGTDSWFTGTVGASGGLFGLFGALLILQRRLGAESTQVLILIVLNFVIGFLYPGISWQGHLGGLIAGAATVGLFFATRPTVEPGADRVALAKKSAMRHGAVVAGLMVLMLAACAVKWWLAATTVYLA